MRGPLPDVIVELLERGIAYSRGRFSVGALHELHAQGRVQVWAVLENTVLRAAVASEVVIYPTGRKVLRVFLIGGRGLHLVPAALRALEEYGRAWGCASIEGEGRRGWARVLRKHGYREVWRAFERELFDA